jgi:hypothetical protein
MVLADGTVLDNLEMNGNNYVSKVEVSGDIFEDNLGTITVDGTVYDNMKLVQCKKHDNEWWFILAPKTKMDKLTEENSELRSRLHEYQSDNLTALEGIATLYEELLTKGVI